MTDIKSCPCCGGQPIVRYKGKNGSYWTSNVFYRSEPGFVECTHCFLRTKEYSRVCRAIEHWNRRVNEE